MIINIKKLALFTLLITPVGCMTTFSRPVSFSEQHQTGDTYMEIRLRGTVELATGKINGIPLAELSGLAWDEDEGLLYAVSDGGSLFHLRPVITDNTLTNVKAVSAYWLLNQKGERLQSADSEGLAILNGNNGVAGDSELVISFEHPPKMARLVHKVSRWVIMFCQHLCKTRKIIIVVIRRLKLLRCIRVWEFSPPQNGL
ncbi:MAG TPA: hypothetical protein ENG03_09615 [Thioploca sp.]|nr:hypothetical protein [Thioploca sp.]